MPEINPQDTDSNKKAPEQPSIDNSIPVSHHTSQPTEWQPGQPAQPNQWAEQPGWEPGSNQPYQQDQPNQWQQQPMQPGQPGGMQQPQQQGYPQWQQPAQPGQVPNQQWQQPGQNTNQQWQQPSYDQQQNQGQKRPDSSRYGGFDFRHPFKSTETPGDSKTFTYMTRLGWFALGLFAGFFGMIMAFLTTDPLQPTRRNTAILWVWLGFLVQAVVFLYFSTTGTGVPPFALPGGGAPTGVGSGSSAFG